MSAGPRSPDGVGRSVALSAAANLSVPLLAILTGPLLARALGPDGRGALAALLVPVSLANLAFTFGMPDALAHFVARGSLGYRRAIRLGLVAGAAAGAVAALVTCLAGFWLHPGRGGGFADLVLLSLTLPATIALAMLRGVGQGGGRFGAISAERLSGAALRLLAIAALFALGALTPVSAAWATVLAAAAGSAFLAPGLRRGWQEARKAPDVPVGAVARYAAAGAAATLSGLLAARLDQLLMAPLCPPAELGLYAVAASLAEIPIALIGAVRDVSFTTAARRGDPRAAADWCRLSLLAVVPICAAGMLAAPVLVPLLYGRAFAGAAPMAQVLFLGTIASTVVAILGAGLMNAGGTALRAWIHVAGAALTAVLLIALLPRWGGLGAAWATAATSTVMGLASLAAFARAASVPAGRCLVPTGADLALLVGKARSLARQFRPAAG